MADGWPQVSWIASHLRVRALAGAKAAIAVAPPAGGARGEAVAVAVDGRPLVVKRARGWLDVADEWFADPSRGIAEAAALELAGSLVADAVPRVVDFDLERAILVLEQAPPTWTDWSSTLAAGGSGGAVAGRLGEVLAIWHRETASSPQTLARFASQGCFEERRLAPWHDALATAHPDLAGAISVAADRLREERLCLVHGGFSPRSVVHGEAGSWVLDWELAHCGAPIFDLALMLADITLAAVRRPDDVELYRALAADFLARYESCGGLLAADDPELGLHVGCLLLARVDGRPAATDLSPEQRWRARDLARRLLCGGSLPAPYPHLWEAAR